MNRVNKPRRGRRKGIGPRPKVDLARDREEVEQLARELRGKHMLLLRGVARTEEDLRFIAGERGTELGDLAQGERYRHLMLRLDDHRRRAIEEIHAALERMAEGSYGTCDGCDGAIPFARLRAVPTARFCIDCASNHERGRPLSRQGESWYPIRLHQEPASAPGFLQDDDPRELFC